MLPTEDDVRQARQDLLFDPAGYMHVAGLDYTARKLWAAAPWWLRAWWWVNESAFEGDVARDYPTSGEPE